MTARYLSFSSEVEFIETLIQIEKWFLDRLRKTTTSSKVTIKCHHIQNFIEWKTNFVPFNFPYITVKNWHRKNRFFSYGCLLRFFSLWKKQNSLIRNISISVDNTSSKCIIVSDYVFIENCFWRKQL